jgi:hypothetical protein
MQKQQQCLQQQPRHERHERQESLRQGQHQECSSSKAETIVATETAIGAKQQQ